MMNGNNNFQMYQNSGYTNNRNRKRTLILDVDDIGETNLGVTGEFNVELYEPLVVDKHSEVYLDNFTSYNSNLANDVDSAAFSLKINEFNMNSNVASTRGVSTDSDGRTTPGGQHMFNSLIIPNEHRNPDNFQTSVVHKGKKFNYVCDINPGTIHSLSGRITDLIGRPAFHDNVSSGTFTYTILDATITINNGRTNIVVGETFNATNNISGTGGGTISLGSFPANINLSNGTLTFTTTEQINTIGTSDPITGVNTNISAVGPFTFTLVDDSSTLRVEPKPSTILIQGHGRFIAEFSIISRD